MAAAVDEQRGAADVACGIGRQKRHHARDFDGVDGNLPVGLDGVDTYPALLAELSVFSAAVDQRQYTLARCP